MKTVPAVLLAVAKELAAQAKSEMPEMREGETIRREWYENGVFYRETQMNEEVFQSQYDFRQRKSHRLVVVK